MNALLLEWKCIGRIRVHCLPRPAPYQELAHRSYFSSRSEINVIFRCHKQRLVKWASPASDKSGNFPSDQDPYESLFKSSLFQSDLVKAEFNSVIGELMSLSRMATSFPDFDLEGKRMFLEKMDEAGSRYEIFIKRLELSSDPQAKEYLRATNAQMLEGGFTLPMMFAGLKSSLGEYRKWVDAEERASVNPVSHQQFKKELKTLWSQSALGRMDMGKMSQMDPQILFQAQKDPQFWKAIKEISDNPSSPEVLRKWLDDPKMGPLVAEMWKQMMAQQHQNGL